MLNKIPPRNIGLDLVRVTETAALAAGRWIGSGDHENAHRIATMAMAEALNTLEMDGRIVIGEDGRIENGPLESNARVGTGKGPAVDLIVDPIDGTNLLIKGGGGAISVVGIAPRGTMWCPVPAVYMEKIVVDKEAAAALVPDCLDAPAAWTLALIARAKNKAVSDMLVFVLDRPRHKDLINEIRQAGARVYLRPEGDAEGALLAALPDSGVDMLYGIGGTAQGVMAACMTRALGGGMLARLAPQSIAERDEIVDAGLDLKQILTCEEIVSSDAVFFAATGITHTPIVQGVQFYSDHAVTHSLLIRGETGTQRIIHAEHYARV
ncbi:MAG: class II fructose-bisphosphatase [Candidatus Thermofonsia bacterium]|nr:MAG: class II fructose-bisphosphatase [Candidatus Thermofonsia bacterium]